MAAAAASAAPAASADAAAHDDAAAYVGAGNTDAVYDVGAALAAAAHVAADHAAADHADAAPVVHNMLMWNCLGLLSVNIGNRLATSPNSSTSSCCC